MQLKETFRLFVISVLINQSKHELYSSARTRSYLELEIGTVTVTLSQTSQMSVSITPPQLVITESEETLPTATCRVMLVGGTYTVHLLKFIIVLLPINWIQLYTCIPSSPV